MKSRIVVQRVGLPLEKVEPDHSEASLAAGSATAPSKRRYASVRAAACQPRKVSFPVVPKDSMLLKATAPSPRLGEETEHPAGWLARGAYNQDGPGTWEPSSLLEESGATGSR